MALLRTLLALCSSIEPPLRLLPCRRATCFRVQLPVLAGLCGSGTLVCIDVLFQRLIVQNSSALTLSIVSSIKELLTVFAGILVFGDEVTTIQFAGMLVAAFGVKLYGSQRRREHAQARKEYGSRSHAPWHSTQPLAFRSSPYCTTRMLALRQLDCVWPFIVSAH